MARITSSSPEFGSSDHHDRSSATPMTSTMSDKENSPAQRTGKTSQVSQQSVMPRRQRSGQGLQELEDSTPVSSLDELEEPELDEPSDEERGEETDAEDDNNERGSNNSDDDDDGEGGEGSDPSSSQGHNEYYDPDQSAEACRKVKRDYRDIERELEVNKEELLKPGSMALPDLLRRSNRAFKGVRQTNEAALDSKILVYLSELALKGLRNTNWDNSGALIDLKDWSDRCKRFMITGSRNDPRAAEEEEVDDDQQDWAYFGREVGPRGTKRPATFDSILGPLSIKKKARIVRERKIANRRKKPETATRPMEITEDGNSKQSEIATANMVAKLKDILADKYSYLEDDEGVNFFEVVVNPDPVRGFSQTIENIFYVSFLAKEGFVAVFEDDDGMLKFATAGQATAEEKESGFAKTSQMLVSMTMWDWKNAIEIFDIKESVIETRPKESFDVSANGWYAS